MNITIVDQFQFVAFWLIFARVLGIVIQLPLFDQQVITSMVKVLFSFLFSFAFFKVLAPTVVKDLHYLGRSGIAILTIYYLVSGLILGYFVKVMMSIFASGLTLINQQIGLSAALYFDMSTGEQIGPLETMTIMALTLLILELGVFNPIFKGIIISFDTFNYVGVSKVDRFYSYFIHFFKEAFGWSLVIASPLIFVNLLITSVLGVMARIIPQMNILLVSFIITIMLGFFVFYIIAIEFLDMSSSLYKDLLSVWFHFIQG